MDFKLEMDSIGRPVFTYETTNSILNEIILSMMIKARSVETDDRGIPVFPGGWFLDPTFGSNLYEIKTITDQSINLAAEYTRQALKWLLAAGMAKNIDVKSYIDPERPTGIVIEISAIQANGEPVGYTHYHGVV